jgi:hypothetical protein
MFGFRFDKVPKREWEVKSFTIVGTGTKFADWERIGERAKWFQWNYWKNKGK